MSCLALCVSFTVSWIPTYCGKWPLGWIKSVCVWTQTPIATATTPSSHSAPNTHTQIVYIYLNKTSRKLGSGKSNNAGLIFKKDWFIFFLHGYCYTMLDSDPQLYGGWLCEGVLGSWSGRGGGQRGEEEYTATISVTGENFITMTSSVTAFI